MCVGMNFYSKISFATPFQYIYALFYKNNIIPPGLPILIILEFSTIMSPLRGFI